MRAVSAGERRSFEQLYAATQTRVRAVVTQVLIDRWQAEEVTQEVFVEIWEKSSAFDSSKGSATSWMLMIAKRRAVDRVRASEASRKRDLRDAERNQHRPYDPVIEMVEARLDIEMLTAGLQRITRLQREAVATTYLQGHTFSEAADHLGASEKAVRTRVRDGLANLRRVIQGSGEAA
jgi:RNA polymerase sigma-70 factor (ECF subfamily)